MENSFLPLDIYENIIPFVNWTALLNLSKTNSFLNIICQKEINKRLKSNYPLGERDGKIKIAMQDLILDKVYVELEENIFGIVRYYNYNISPKKYFYPFIRDILHDFFVFSFKTKEWSLSPNTIKLACKSKHFKNGPFQNIYVFKKKDNCKPYSLLQIY